MWEILQGKRIVLGVTGGIAAYKAVELLRLLVQAQAVVEVVMTAHAREFIQPLTFAALSGRKVHTDLFGPNADPLEHISLGQETDALVIAPATANIIGKLAAGIADDLLSTIALAATVPVLLCPAMNVRMYENPAVQDNLQKLAGRGLTVVPPETGPMACGAYGPGRLPEPATIMEYLAARLTLPDLKGYHLLVSAGPTHEDLDPVRFLTNRSSGKMGYALARQAWRRGAAVTLVSGPTALPAPVGVERIPVRSALEMQQALVDHFPTCDALLMAAAVSDYRPKEVAAQKLKRGGADMVVHLTHNPDILSGLSRLRRHQILVGFAAETAELYRHAHEKLLRKGLDLIVANDVQAPQSGFAVDTNQVTIIAKDGDAEALPLLTKDQVANRILDRVAALLRARREAC